MRVPREPDHEVYLTSDRRVPAKALERREIIVLARVGRQSWHTRRNPETCRRRQLMAPVPLLPREIDPVGALHPQLRREIVARQNIVKPVRPVLAQPCFLVLVPNQ